MDGMPAANAGKALCSSAVSTSAGTASRTVQPSGAAAAAPAASPTPRLPAWMILATSRRLAPSPAATTSALKYVIATGAVAIAVGVSGASLLDAPPGMGSHGCPAAHPAEHRSANSKRHCRSRTGAVRTTSARAADFKASRLVCSAVPAPRTQRALGMVPDISRRHVPLRRKERGMGGHHGRRRRRSAVHRQVAAPRAADGLLHPPGSAPRSTVGAAYSRRRHPTPERRAPARGHRARMRTQRCKRSSTSSSTPPAE
jgi:hypothetical protein